MVDLLWGGGRTFLKCSLHTLHKYVMLSCNFLHHVNPITTLKGSVILEEFLHHAMSEHLLSLICFHTM